MEPLYILGPQRSGTTLLAALLDGHPDIAVWPREWRFFTTFWKTVPGEHSRKRVGDITHAARAMFEKAAAPAWRDRLGEYRNEGKLDLGVLTARLAEHSEERVSPADYVVLLGQAFAAAHRDYTGTAPRYFAIKTMIAGIDWSEVAHLQRAKTLYMVRPLASSYQSQKRLFLGNGPAAGSERRAYQYFRDQCFPLIYLAKQALDVRGRLTHDERNHMILLDQLRRDPEGTLRAVAAFLDVSFAPGMLTPTFLGAIYAGHFNDPSLNRGRIVDAETAYPALGAFEDYYLGRLERAYLSGREAEPLGPLAQRIRNAARASAEACPHNLGFRVLTFANLLGVDRHIARIWRHDLSGAPFRPAMLLRPPRGYKTRLTRSVRRVLGNASPS
jgi:hypothetical protein